MVNTFLTVLGDPVKSAESLDYRRLGKQRVEAKQILDKLIDLRLLAECLILLGYSTVTIFPFGDRSLTFDQRRAWIKNILTIVKTLPSYNSSSKLLINTQIKQLYITSKSNIIGSEQIHLREFKMGFVNHPCVVMWLGFEVGLEYYINCHIEEWVRRGYNNTMILYDLRPYYSNGIHLPNWCYSEPVIDAFRFNLVFKEIDRCESLHYLLKLDFVHSFTNNATNLYNYVTCHIINNYNNNEIKNGKYRQLLLSYKITDKPYIWTV